MRKVCKLVKKIGDYEGFLEVQARYSRNISNDFFLPAELRERIENGVLSFSAGEKALFMYEAREGFSKLYFRVEDITAKLPQFDGILAAYLTYRDGRYPDAAADWLRGNGFEYKKTLLRHSAGKITGELTDKGVEKPTPDEVYSMIGRYFSAVEADLPCRGVNEEKGSYCIRAPDGEPMGVFYDMGRSRIVAVSEKARGQGVGKRLFLAYALKKFTENENHVFYTWIAPDNAPSLAMYRSLGFVQDSTKTDCFISV